MRARPELALSRVLERRVTGRRRDTPLPASHAPPVRAPQRFPMGIHSPPGRDTVTASHRHFGPPLGLPPRLPWGSPDPGFSRDSGEFRAEQKPKPAGLPKAFPLESRGQRPGSRRDPAGMCSPVLCGRPPRGLGSAWPSAGQRRAPSSPPPPAAPPWAPEGQSWGVPQTGFGRRCINPFTTGGGWRGGEGRADPTTETRTRRANCPAAAPKRAQDGVPSWHLVPTFSSTQLSPQDPSGHLRIQTTDRGPHRADARPRGARTTRESESCARRCLLFAGAVGVLSGRGGGRGQREGLAARFPGLLRSRWNSRGGTGAEGSGGREPLTPRSLERGGQRAAPLSAVPAPARSELRAPGTGTGTGQPPRCSRSSAARAPAPALPARPARDHCRPAPPRAGPAPGPRAPTCCGGARTRGAAFPCTPLPLPTASGCSASPGGRAFPAPNPRISLT